MCGFKREEQRRKYSSAGILIIAYVAVIDIDCYKICSGAQCFVWKYAGESLLSKDQVEKRKYRR